MIIKIFFIKSYEKITLLLLSIVFFGSTLLAFYHFGIEQGLFNDISLCSAEDLTKDELLKKLEKDIISCKDVSFRILGLSLATINTIFSLFLSVIFLKLFLNYEKN